MITDNVRKTASQIRIESHRQQQAYDMLATHPQLQAEKIVKHYVAHADIALQIFRLLEFQEHAKERDANVDSLIQMLLSQIKENHRSDLGIALEWNKSKPPEWLSQALNEGNGTYKP